MATSSQAGPPPLTDTQVARPLRYRVCRSCADSMRAQVQVLRVAAAELRSLKDGRAVYQQRGSVFFLADKQRALSDAEARLAAAATKQG